jgi:hypothetical protein
MEDDFIISYNDDLKIDYMVDQNVYIKSSLLSRIFAKLGHSSSLSLLQTRKTQIITCT